MLIKLSILQNILHKSKFEMKEIRLLFISLLLLLNIVFSACSGSNGEDQDQLLMNSIQRGLNEATESLKRANSGKAAGEALLTYARKMEAISENVRILDKQYPKLNKTKEVESEFKISYEKFLKASADAISKYGTDFEFRMAQDEFKRIWSEKVSKTLLYN